LGIDTGAAGTTADVALGGPRDDSQSWGSCPYGRKGRRHAHQYVQGADFHRHRRISPGRRSDTILDTAFQLKLERARGVQHHLLAEQDGLLIFYNRSLRTRNSFECGIMHLGGHANYLDSNSVYTPAAAGAERAYVTERLRTSPGTLSRFGEAIAIRIYGEAAGWNYGQGNDYVRAFRRPRPIFR